MQGGLLDTIDRHSPNFNTRASEDSAFELLGAGDVKDGMSAHGDSGEYGQELEERARSNSLQGERLSKPLTTVNTKNRAAQRRYRERQKDKMETYKQQVEELSKRLDNLQTENESLEKRNHLLEKLVQMKDQRSRAATDSSIQEVDEVRNSIWQNADTYTAVADYVNTVRRHKHPILTPQEAAEMSPEDLKQNRVIHVKELATLLLAHGGDENSESHRELEDYVLQVRLAGINLLNSMSVRSFAQVLAVKKRMCHHSHMSERMMAAIKLTPDQKRAYIKARAAVSARNEEIKERRRRIVCDLELAVPSIAPMCGNSETVAMLRACESSDQFKASLEAEHQSMIQFHIDCCQVLTPLQEARSMVEAHPGTPDPWLISGYALAEQNGFLAEWLHSYGSSDGSTLQDLGNADIKLEPESLSSTTYSDLPSSTTVDGTTHFGGLAARHPDFLVNDSKVNGLANCSGVPKYAQELQPLPLQCTPQGLQDLLSAPPLDEVDPVINGIGEDDMWVDFFPGLLTQTPG